MLRLNRKLRMLAGIGLVTALLLVPAWTLLSAGAAVPPTGWAASPAGTGQNPGGTSAAGTRETPDAGRVQDDGLQAGEPDDRLSRAELAVMLAESLDLDSPASSTFADVTGHWAGPAIAAVAAAGLMDGQPDGTFRPERAATRAEAAIAVLRAAKLDELADAAAVHLSAESPFPDVLPVHRAFPAIALLEHIGAWPVPAGEPFGPEEPVFRDEAAQALEAALRMEIASGRLVQVNAPGRSLSLEDENGRRRAFVLGPDTLIVRNGAAVEASELLPGDQVQAVADATGQLKAAATSGQERTRAAEIGAAAMELLQELLTPEQTAAILARDWDRAGQELRESLYNQLLARGATPDEAAAILSQDWDALEEHGKERLTALATQRLPVDPSLIRALLDQNWEEARSQAEVEVLEYLLNRLLQTSANA